MSKIWKKISGYEVAPTKYTGVLEKKDGGFLLRARVVEKATGRLREIRRVVNVETPLEALGILEEEKAKAKAGPLAPSTEPSSRLRFAEYAPALVEKKIKARQIKSAASRQNWKTSLKHLVLGDEGVPGLGDYFMTELKKEHIEAWRDKVIDNLISPGIYSPKSCNGWMRDLKVILKAAFYELKLKENPCAGVEMFDDSEWETYTHEEPNSLTPDEVPRFLAAMREMHPQHYAMIFLGFTTGLRPSSMRPLRRNGPKADVLWDEGAILVRRSQTRGKETMNVTKQGTRYRIAACKELIDVLRWHVETQLVRDEQQASELLFPSITGGYRSPTVLNKPFAAVAKAIGLKKKVSQKGMRRTFQDLARAADVSDIVTRSISGHLTDEMQRHYSTVNQNEQRAALGKVIQLFKVG